VVAIEDAGLRSVMPCTKGSSKARGRREAVITYDQERRPAPDAGQTRAVGERRREADVQGWSAVGKSRSCEQGTRRAMSEVTVLLNAARGGDATAADRLFSLLYDDLRQL